jgi:hypothetical protein
MSIAGAVTPAMNPTTGLRLPSALIHEQHLLQVVHQFHLSLIHSVSGSFINNSTTSLVVVPMIGSPPIPIVVIPKPCFTWSAASYVNVPDLDTIPTVPFLKQNLA